MLSLTVMPIEPGAIVTTRRYYRLRRLAAHVTLDPGLESTWQYMQEAEPGTDLPSDFPGRAKLIASGYSAVEDIEGATIDELVTYAGLSYSAARAAVAAVNG